MLTVFQNKISSGPRQKNQIWWSSGLTSAHLLSDHNNTRGLGGTPEPRNGEYLQEAGEEIVGLGHTHFFNEQFLVDELSVNVIEIPCCLKGRASKAEK